jgi:glycerol-3-phosphate acyltransferase PlsY
MGPAAAAGAAAAAGYLCGSVPFAWIVVRARTGADLRRTGSGNVGATNAARVLGRRWFPALFALDAAKGAGAVLLAGFLGDLELLDHTSGEWTRAAAALGAVLGHAFPVWLGFKGGKAVATGAGALLAWSPIVAGAGLAAFVLVAALWRFVSLGSVAAALAAAAAGSWLAGRGRPGDERLPLTAFVWTLAAVVVVLHLPNLRRIAQGTEPRLGGGGEGDRGKG